MVDKTKDGKTPEKDSGTDAGLVLPGESEFPIQGFLDDGTENGLETDDHQAAEIREIFGTAFPQYLQPVEELIEDLLSGNGDPDSIEALDGMITSLMEASSRMGFADINKLLSQLRLRIASIDTESSGPPKGDIREEILGNIMDLKDIAEEMGGQIDSTPKEQQRTIVSALKDKEGVGKVVLKRLSAAGLITVDQLLMARPDEIAAVAGIDIKLVHTILGHLSEKGDSKGSAPQDQSEEMSAEVEELHKRVLDKLHTEAEIEVAIEALKAEIRGLRSRIFELRAEIKSLDISLEERKRAWDSFSRQMADKKELIDDFRARRDAQTRKFASTEESIKLKELKLQSIRRQRRAMEMEALSLSRAVGGLVNKIQKVRRAIVKRQNV